METIHQTVSQKILKRKHWIKTYESRKAKLALKYKGRILWHRTALLTRKIENWKKQIEYYISAKNLEAKAKGTAMIKKEKSIREVYVLAHKYFDLKNIMDIKKENRTPKIFLFKYILENGGGGNFAFKLFGIKKDSLYYYRKAYNPKKQGKAYRAFVSAMKDSKITVKRINKK